MKEYWSRRIRDAVPYVPGEQPRGRTFIKLNTNECPYAPSPRVAQAIGTVEPGDLRLYPDPECRALRETIAGAFGLTADNIFVGNGSDEVLAFAFQAFFDPDRELVFPQISYSFYPVYARYFGLKARMVPMGEDFSVDVAGLLHSQGGVVLANPNAPTGMGLPLEDIRAILEANRDVVVLVDEAYVDFGGRSAAGLIPEYPNLLVVHTLSKSRGLAGLRVGWAMGHPDLIAGLRCVRDSINSYTLDRLAQAGAQAAIEDVDYFRETCRRVMATRERTARGLEALGCQVLPSQANFLFVRCPGREGKDVLDELRQRGILVRWWYDPAISQWLRISIGTDGEMDALLCAMGEILGQ